MKKKEIYLIDFDKTVTDKDTTDELMRIYNENLLLKYQERIRNGFINVAEYLTGLLESLDISKEEFEKNIVLNVKVDSYFENFITLRDNFRIVSAGTYENVSSVLKANKISIEPYKIYSNRVFFANNKLKVELYDKKHPHGIDKRKIVEKYKKEFTKVIFIGDGSTDIEVADTVDILYAKKDSTLEKYCINKGIAYKTYKTFEDIE